MTDPLQQTTFNFMGQTFAVRPSFRLISKIETATAQSAIIFTRKLIEREASMMEIAAAMHQVVQECPELAKKTASDVGEALMEEGVEGIYPVLTLLCGRVAVGNKEHERQAAAAAQNPPAKVETAQD